MTPALPVAAIAILCVVSLAFPPLAARSVSSSAELVLSDPLAALDAARDAARLDPLSLSPLFSQADAQFVLGRSDVARGLYIEATDRQPKNSDTWLALAGFELDEGHLAEADAAVKRAVELDPFSRRVQLLRDEIDRELVSSAG